MVRLGGLRVSSQIERNQLRRGFSCERVLSCDKHQNISSAQKIPITTKTVDSSYKPPYLSMSIYRDSLVWGCKWLSTFLVPVTILDWEMYGNVICVDLKTNNKEWPFPWLSPIIPRKRGQSLAFQKTFPKFIFFTKWPAALFPTA